MDLEGRTALKLAQKSRQGTTLKEDRTVRIFEEAVQSFIAQKSRSRVQQKKQAILYGF
jgi:hypothetical protein